MFRANLKCEVSLMTGSDGYGKRTYGDWTTARFAIVKLERSSRKTSVRTDSSGSRGYAQDIEADARFLFHSETVLTPGDRVRFGSVMFTVVSVFPRHRVTGEFDHYQVDLNIWAG